MFVEGFLFFLFFKLFYLIDLLKLGQVEGVPVKSLPLQVISHNRIRTPVWALTLPGHKSLHCVCFEVSSVLSLCIKLRPDIQPLV